MRLASHIAKGTSTLAAGLLLMINTAMAAPLKPKTVLATSLITVSVDSGGKTNSLYCLGREPGRGKVRSSGKILFTPLRYTLTLEKKKLRAKPKNAKLKRTVRALTQLIAAALSACTSPSPTATPTATPAPSQPTATPTPIATATPNPRAVFDSSGNVTALGKGYLGIPSNLNASIDAGEVAHGLYSCAGCHLERTNRSFQNLEVALPASPMNFPIPDQISYQQLADLVAYLNRFQLEVP